MTEIAKKFELFQLNDELKDHLTRLSSSHFPLQAEAKNVLIETVILDQEGKKVVKQETQRA